MEVKTRTVNFFLFKNLVYQAYVGKENASIRNAEFNEWKYLYTLSSVLFGLYVFAKQNLDTITLITLTF